MNKLNKEISESYENETEIDIKELFFSYIKYWYYFVFALFFSFLAAFYYAKYTTPVYRIVSSILIKDDKKSADNLLSELDLFSSKKTIENEIEILKSKSLMEKAISELDFNVSYFWIGNVTVAELYKETPFKIKSDTIIDENAQFDVKILNESEYDINLTSFEGKTFQRRCFFGKRVNTPLGVFSLEKTDFFNDEKFSDLNLPQKSRNFMFRFNKIENTVGKYRSRLSIELADKKASVLKISVQDEVPEKGKDLLNKFIEVYINSGIEEKNELGRKTLNFVKERLSFIANDLGEIELGEENYKTDKGITDISSEGKLFLESVKSFDNKLAEVNIKISAIEALEEYLKNENSSLAFAPASIGIEDPLLIKIVNQLSELEIQKSRLMGNSKLENPVYLNLNIENQIKKTKLILEENTKKIKENLVSNKKVVEENISKLEEKLKSLPKSSRELLSIHRQQTIKENLYLYLLQKQEETAVSIASTVSDCRVLDFAEVNKTPIKPVKNLVYLIALFVGLIVPVVFISLKNFFNNKVLNVSDIEKYTNGTPIIGKINQAENENNLVISAQSKTAISEQFRSIRTNLQYFSRGKNLKTILITSNMSGEGKTFIATNVATSLALSGKKTILLEFDLRKPKLLKGIGMSSDLGLSNFLIGSVDLNDIIKETNFNENLHIISSGPIPPNPSELILLDRMELLINQLKDRYDYIVIDSPPVGLVTDGFILSKFADSSLFVVRQSITDCNQLMFIKDIYYRGHLTNMSIVFNGLVKGVGKYGYGEKYGQGYGHSYYEEDKSMDRSILKRIKQFFTA